MSSVRTNAALKAGAFFFLLSLPLAAQVANDDPSALPSEAMPRASHSLLLDVTHADSGWVAVGERGHVLTSVDGKDWTQVETPTRSTLTTVTAVGDQLWAGGHDGVIIHSADGGKTWVAQRRDPYQLAEGEHPADHDVRQGAPVMDILFSDASNGIAIGAYSLMLVTHDGGATWTARQATTAPAAPVERTEPTGDIFSEDELQLDDESNPHLNAITRTGPRSLLIVGERGTVLRSSDDGESWQKQSFPYKGSMFGVLHLENGSVLAYGLRGNVYESRDGGGSWSKVPTQGSVSLMGGSALGDGGAVLAGANGTVLRRDSGDAPFVASAFRNAAGEMPTLSGVAPAGDGNYVLVGDKGADLAPLK